MFFESLTFKQIFIRVKLERKAQVKGKLNSEYIRPLNMTLYEMWIALWYKLSYYNVKG